MSAAAVTFAAVLPALLVAHNVADHWLQTDHQAGHKGLPGWAGRVACARHVASYTLATATVVGLLWLLLGLQVSLLGFAAGQLVSAGTHYWADRRFTLASLCDRLGKGGFYRLGAPRKVAAWTDTEERDVQLFEAGNDRPVPWDNPSLGTGAYALDQSWHWWWLFVAALLTAVI